MLPPPPSAREMTQRCSPLPPSLLCTLMGLVPGQAGALRKPGAGAGQGATLSEIALHLKNVEVFQSNGNIPSGRQALVCCAVHQFAKSRSRAAVPLRGQASRPLSRNRNSPGASAPPAPSRQHKGEKLAAVFTGPLYCRLQPASPDRYVFLAGGGGAAAIRRGQRAGRGPAARLAALTASSPRPPTLKPETPAPKSLVYAASSRFRRWGGRLGQHPSRPTWQELQQQRQRQRGAGNRPTSVHAAQRPSPHRLMSLRTGEDGCFLCYATYPEEAPLGLEGENWGLQLVDGDF